MRLAPLGAIPQTTSTYPQDGPILPNQPPRPPIPPFYEKHALKILQHCLTVTIC